MRRVVEMVLNTFLYAIEIVGLKLATSKKDSSNAQMFAKASLDSILKLEKRVGVYYARAAIGCDSTLPEAHALLSLGYLLQGNRSEAEIVYQQARTSEFTHDFDNACRHINKVLTERAWEALQQRHPENAILFGNMAVFVERLGRDACKPLGLAYLIMGDNESARKVFLLTLSTNINQSHDREKGSYSSTQGVTGNRFTSLVETNPPFFEIVQILVQVANSYHNTNDIITKFKEASYLDSHSLDWLLATGLIYIQESRLEDAVKTYDLILLKNPSVAVAHQGLAFALHGLRRQGDALQQIRLASELAPHDPEIANLRRLIEEDIVDSRE